MIPASLMSSTMFLGEAGFAYDSQGILACQ